jgi:phosphoribosylamine---glycine ligase
MAAKGYPGNYVKDTIIRGLDNAESIEGVKIFHAGTALKNNTIFAVGGRVLGVTAIGKDFAQARERAYRAVSLIDWPEGFCRTDIGYQAVSD